MDNDAFSISAFSSTADMAEKPSDTLSETSASSTTHLLGIVPDEPSTEILPTMAQNIPASTSRATFRISKLAENPPELLPKKPSPRANPDVEIPVIGDFQTETGSAMETIVVINTIEEVVSVESNSVEFEFAPEDFLETPPIRRRNRMHLQPCCCFRMCNWFPKMCSCLDTEGSLSNNRMSGRVGTYERLGNAPTIFEFGNTTQRERRREPPTSKESNEDTDRQEELSFYNDDQSWTAVVVEKNLRTIDLCELLKVKRNASGIAWSVVETWPELGIERTLEDHEDILAVHREMEPYTVRHHRKFFFRQDFLKYDFFINPKQFFPSEMVSFPNDEDRSEFLDVESALRNYLSRDDVECPQVFSQVWIRDESSKTWRKMQMLLQGRKLYTTRKVDLLLRCVNYWKQKKESKRMYRAAGAAVTKRTLDNEPLTTFAHLSDYYIYRIPNAKRYFDAPFEWGACLSPSSNAEAQETDAADCGFKIISFQSEKSRACWLTAMRLAKYGKQLRENYRAFKNKQCEQGGGSPKEQYNSYNVPNESLRSRVAMDFTGSVGRIVEDPKEARDIAENEGIAWRRRWRPFSRPPPGCATVRLHGLDNGIHVLQPWFHSGLKRECAAAILKDHGTVDGVFLVRNSRSNPGAYVLTYKYGDKIFHAQIQPVFDERRNCWLYTLDKGATKFYDLLQLIEFYQLNAGALPTRLTHYVQNGVPVPTRTDEGGASPSPPEGSQRFNPKNDCTNLPNI